MAAWLVAAATTMAPAAAQKIIHVGPGNEDATAESVGVYKYGARVSGTPKDDLPRVITPDFAVPGWVFFPPCPSAPPSHAHEAGKQSRFNGVTAGHDAPRARRGAGTYLDAGGSHWASHIEGGLTVEGGSRWASHIQPGRTVEGGSRWAGHIRSGRTVRNGARWASTIPSWPRGVRPSWASR